MVLSAMVIVDCVWSGSLGFSGYSVSVFSLSAVVVLCFLCKVFFFGEGCW